MRLCERVQRAKAARMRLCVSKLGARETARMRPSERECRERTLPECDCVRVQRANAAKMRPCVSKLGARETARMRPSERECRERKLPECDCVSGESERCQNPTV